MGGRDAVQLGDRGPHGAVRHMGGMGSGRKPCGPGVPTGALAGRAYSGVEPRDGWRAGGRRCGRPAADGLARGLGGLSGDGRRQMGDVLLPATHLPRRRPVARVRAGWLVRGHGRGARAGEPRLEPEPGRHRVAGRSSARPARTDGGGGRTRDRDVAMAGVVRDHPRVQRLQPQHTHLRAGL